MLCFDLMRVYPPAASRYLIVGLAVRSMLLWYGTIPPRREGEIFFMSLSHHQFMLVEGQLPYYYW